MRSEGVVTYGGGGWELSDADGGVLGEGVAGAQLTSGVLPEREHLEFQRSTTISVSMVITYQ